MIHWNCQQCGEALEAPESMAGDRLGCARCGMEQPVGGGVHEALTAAMASDTESPQPADARIAAARRELELERIEARPVLRAALKQIAWALAAYLVLSVGMAFIASGPGLLDTMSVGVSILWLLAAVWLVGGVVRALLAGARMI